MGNRTQGRKKSNFPAQTGVPSGATLDYVSSGVNYKILYSDFLSGLGVSGSLEQSSANGSPVLDDQGSVKVIRNIIGGFGMATQVDAQNDIEISTDFTFDDGGVAIVDDVNDPSPDFRSFIAGTGINIAGSTGEIQIAVTGVPASTKTIVVAQKSDLPTPSGGVITLEDDTEYLFVDDVSIDTDRLQIGDVNVLSAPDSSLITLTYTGTGAMMTSVENSLTVKDIGLSAENGSYIDLIGDGSGFDNFISRNCAFLSCASFGTIEDWGLTVIAEAFSINAAEGLSFVGTQGRFALNQISLTNTAGTILDLGTATFDIIYIGPNTTFNTVSGVTGINAAANSANINSGGSGVMSGSAVVGGGTLSVGIDPSDLRWEITGVRGVDDTLKDTLSYNTAGTTVVISAINTPVLVGGTWVDDNSSQFTVDGAGTVTYIGIEPLHAPITAGITSNPASGSNKDYGGCIAINGVAVAESTRAGRASATDRQSITPIWQHEFVTGDTCSIMLENNSDTTNFEITHAVLRVN